MLNLLYVGTVETVEQLLSLSYSCRQRHSFHSHVPFLIFAAMAPSMVVDGSAFFKCLVNCTNSVMFSPTLQFMCGDAVHAEAECAVVLKLLGDQLKRCVDSILPAGAGAAAGTARGCLADAEVPRQFPHTSGPVLSPAEYPARVKDLWLAFIASVTAAPDGDAGAPEPQRLAGLVILLQGSVLQCCGDLVRQCSCCPLVGRFIKHVMTYRAVVAFPLTDEGRAWRCLRCGCPRRRVYSCQLVPGRCSTGLAGRHVAHFPKRQGAVRSRMQLDGGHVQGMKTCSLSKHALEHWCFLRTVLVFLDACISPACTVELIMFFALFPLPSLLGRHSPQEGSHWCRIRRVSRPSLGCLCQGSYERASCACS